ncbi:MAG: response regulator [Gaiellaceae bacterium]
MTRPVLGRVLVVDDEDDIRNMLAVVLAAEGWVVDSAAGGGEALARCTRTTYDAVILDQRMPGIPGVEVARRLTAHGFPGRLVLFSAYVDPEIERACAALGVVVVDKVDWYALVDSLAEAVLVAS